MKAFSALPVIAAASTVLLWSQPERPNTTFRTETALMQIDVRVKDRGGHPVTHLTRDDFQLSEDGVAQDIATFEFVGNRRGGPDGRAPVQGPTKAPPPLTRIYIATDLAPPSGLCGSTWEFDLFFRGVRKFLENNRRPGTEVSFNGTPFSADRDQLLATLDLLRDNPNGRSTPGKPDWLPPLVSGHGILEQGLECDGWTVTERSGNPFEARERIAKPSPEILLQLGQLGIERYIDLTRKLAEIEGKKTVVLFARGLAIGRDNTAALNRLAREALRARVVFHTVIPTALRAPNSNLARQGSTNRVMDGLFAVAENTGGQALRNTNDFSEVFDRVEAASSNYYLLGYYPHDRSERGRLRQVRVSLPDRGLRVEAVKGYYEPKAFRELDEGERKMLFSSQVLGDAAYTDIPVLVGFEFFRSTGGRPRLVYSTGVPAEWIRAQPGRTLLLKVAARAASLTRAGLPQVMEQSIEFTLDPSRQRALQFPASMELDTGRYEWKVVVRDELTGAVGSYRSVMEIPSFEGATTPSSLMLTSQAVPASAAKGDGIDIGGERLYPEAGSEFRLGQPILMAYELYNVTEQLMAAAPAPRVFLLKEEKPLERPPFDHYDVHRSETGRTLSYVATLDTASLAAGEYTLVVAVPDSGNGISRKFVLGGPFGRQ